MIWDIMGPFTILPIPKTPPGKNVTDPDNDVHGEDVFASWNKDIDDTKQNNNSKQNNNKEQTGKISIANTLYNVAGWICIAFSVFLSVLFI